MRGLDARVLLAKARIANITDAVKAETLRIDAWLAAQLVGYRDARSGIKEPPLQFAGEPELLREWKDGQETYLLTEEMRDCSICSDSRGDPCHIHG